MSHLSKKSKIYLVILITVFAGLGLLVSLFPNAPVQAQVVSPEVQPDGTVIFRYDDPSATEVELAIEMGRNELGAMCYTATGWPVLDMVDDGTGVWSITIPEMEPNVYNYHFNVDGVRTLDPENPTWDNNADANNNQVYVPGPGNEWQSIQDVPHGQLLVETYFSDFTQSERPYTVYLPPNYDKDSRTYPTFYLSHGGGGNHIDWSTQGVANNILDNLIAQKEIRPMIVIMPNASGIRGDDYRIDLLNSLIPDVEAKYRVNHNPQQRAFAGLSMGAGLAANILRNNPEEFGFIGMWSGGGLTVENLEPNLATISQMRNIDISVGAMDFAYPGAVRSMEALDYYGIPYTGLLTPGDCHTWYFWRMALYEWLTGPLF